jgi:cytochrome c-type biogenesis protein CcmH
LRGRQEAALALHRAQLQELDRDLEEGRLVPSEHEAAKLEVQRRLLADAALAEPVQARSSALAIGLAALLVPATALGLYLSVGHPEFPPKGRDAPPPLTPEQQAKAEADDRALAQLRARLQFMDPHAPRTLEGYLLLGRTELSRGELPEAAAAFQHVLEERFDPTLAAETAEVLTQASGRITPEALALFKRAVAEAPPDAKWKPMAEQRIAEARGS